MFWDFGSILFRSFTSLIRTLQTVSDEIMLSAQILIINPMVGGWDQVSLFCIFYICGGAWLICKQFPPQVTNQQYYLISSWSFQSKLIVVYLLTFRHRTIEYQNEREISRSVSNRNPEGGKLMGTLDGTVSTSFIDGSFDNCKLHLCLMFQLEY